MPPIVNLISSRLPGPAKYHQFILTLDVLFHPLYYSIMLSKRNWNTIERLINLLLILVLPTKK
jgi:hypothetical protein